MRFMLNQKVTSKKTGLPMVGKVLGIQSPVVLALTHGLSSQVALEKIYPNWTNLYPEWATDWVYTIMFDTPARHMSLQEYKTHHPDATMEEYKEEVPVNFCATYPQDDLETINIEERLETSEINSRG